MASLREPTMPWCKVCGGRAVVWIREIINGPPLAGADGTLVVPFAQPGRMEGFCSEHWPRPKPLEAGLLC